MTAPHSPTPWRCEIRQGSIGSHVIIFDANDDAIINSRCSSPQDASDKAIDMDRLCTCVNACAGLANPEKLPELIAAITAEALEWANFYPDPSDTEGLSAKFAANSALRPIIDALRALQATPAESDPAEEAQPETECGCCNAECNKCYPHKESEPA